METIRVNQGSLSPFNPFNILCTEILLPYNQGTVIFSNFAELAGVSLTPPWVLNSYSATRMLNRRVLHIIRYVCICIIVVAGTTCTAWARGRSQNAANVPPCFSSEGQGTPTLIFLCSYVLPWEIGNLGVLQLQPARVWPRLHPIEEIDPGTSRDSDALLQTTLSKYRRTTGAARFSQSDTNLFEVLSLCWACGHLPSLAIRATTADLNSLKNWYEF